MKKIQKILISNRGEIAIRIIQSAKELGIKTVCIYTDVDRCALHVKRADEVYRLVNGELEPYLDIEQIVEIAHAARVDAVHPGYGFLSENADFAAACEQAGIQGIRVDHLEIEIGGIFLSCGYRPSPHRRYGASHKCCNEFIDQ